MEFFNDLGKRFSSVARSVTEKTKDSMEVTRIVNDLRIQKNTLEQLYKELGMACYALRMGDGEPEQAEQLSERIQRTRARIEELTAQRDALRDVRRCLSCGAVMPREARFCSACGKRMAEDPPQTDDNGLADREYCPDCGAQRGENDRFCVVCGRPFEAASPATPPKRPDFDIPTPSFNAEEPDIFEDDFVE